MKWVFALIAMSAGAGLAFQVGFNSHLRTRWGHPIPAALTNFGVGFLCLLTLAVVSGMNWPGPRAAMQAPWWAYMGGVVGAVYVATSAAFARRIGAAGWLAAVVTGQIVASLALDHFGAVGFPITPISPLRLLGAVLLLGGVILVLTS